jgi:hypothetical protein
MLEEDLNVRVTIKLPPELRISRRPDKEGELIPLGDEVIFDIEAKQYEHYVPLAEITVEAEGKTLTHKLFYWTDKGRIVDGR